MSNSILWASAIFMCISGVGVLFLSIAGLFALAFLMTCFLAIFFAVFVVSVRKREKGWTAVKQPKRRIMTDECYMRYCAACGFTGSQKPGEAVPTCPICGHQLLATDTSLSRFSAMKEEERDALKRTWGFLG